MIDKDELLFVVDENNNPLEPKPRYEVHKSRKIWHRTVHIFIVNKKNEVLCQKRSFKKDINPGKWEAFVGGHLAAGESYLDGALKEIKEELGLELKSNDLKPFKMLANHYHPEFRMLYRLKWDDDVSKLNLEKDEVEELRWFSLKTLRKLLLDKKDKRWTHKADDEQVLNWLEQK